MNIWISNFQSVRANEHASDITNKLSRNWYNYITSCLTCTSKGDNSRNSHIQLTEFSTSMKITASKIVTL